MNYSNSQRAGVILYLTALIFGAYEKTRDVNRQAIGEFIDVDEAYRRIKTFVVTSQFSSLPEDDQMNAIAFILVTERTPSESVMGNCIAEAAITKALNQLREKSTNA